MFYSRYSVRVPTKTAWWAAKGSTIPSSTSCNFTTIASFLPVCSIMAVLYRLREFPKSDNKSIRKRWSMTLMQFKNIYSNSPKIISLFLWKIVNPKDIRCIIPTLPTLILFLRKAPCHEQRWACPAGGENIGSIRAGTKDWKCLGRLGKPKQFRGKGKCQFKV